MIVANDNGDDGDHAIGKVFMMTMMKMNTDSKNDS